MRTFQPAQSMDGPTNGSLKIFKHTFQIPQETSNSMYLPLEQTIHVQTESERADQHQTTQDNKP